MRPRLVARCYSHAAVLTKPQTPPQHYQQQHQRCIREQLRELLRETAQPVAVVTAFMPQQASSSSGPAQPDSIPVYHGATLSSFTSIAMDPFPLIAFALRLPSRMATTLNAAASPTATTTSHTSHPTPVTEAHMVINILASNQAKHAHVFSRPDLFPRPFSDPNIPYTLSQDGLPVFNGSIGAMSCRLVGRGLPLHDLDFLIDTRRREELELDSGTAAHQPGWNAREDKRPAPLAKGAVASELFIAQVTRIEALASRDTQVGDDAPQTLPLLYHRKQFTSCNPSKPLS